MVFEDVHWIDATSLELLSLAVDRTPKLPLLLFVTSAPSSYASVARPIHVTQINLDRLPRDEARK